MKNLKEYINEEVKDQKVNDQTKYTIRTTPGQTKYITKNFFSNIWLDSDHNIFPSAAACAKFHGVSSSTIENDWFKSKTTGQLTAAVCPNQFIDNYDEFIKLLDGKHDNELDKILGRYDELFQDYLLKKIHAGFNDKGDIVKAWKTKMGFWTIQDPKDVPWWVDGKFSVDRLFDKK